MKARVLIGAVAGLLCALGMWRAESRPQKAEVMTVQTDLARLSTWIKLPPGARAARWIVRTLGTNDPDVPGPTDTLLTAFVQLDEAAWPAFDRALAGPRPERELKLDEAVAQALLVDLAPAVHAGVARTIRGPSYDVRMAARLPYRGELAVRYKDGLVFQLMTQ